MEYRAAVCAEIRAMMGRRDMRQRDVARALRCDEKWLSRRLRAEVAFDVDDLHRLALVLHCREVDLLPHLDSNQKPAGYRLRERRLAALIG
jgi:transcriptional regulator with XRE-family HTH domain